MIALRITGPAVRVPGHTGQDSGASPIRSRAAETSTMSSSPKPVRRSSYHSAAPRSSARASGWSSRRTSLFEFLQDLGPRVFPADRLNVTFSDLSGTPLQLGRPCRGDFFVRLLQTGKQFLRDTSAVNASQAQGLGQQLVRRHDVILAFAPENGCDPSVPIQGAFLVGRAIRSGQGMPVRASRAAVCPRRAAL